MPSDLHKRLVDAGERWIRRQGFAVVATELATFGSCEQADVVAFRSSCSAIIEAKATRADFLADHRKPHRREGGLGQYRFYLCEPGIIAIEDLPDRWGLLLLTGRRVTMEKGPIGNIWPPYGSGAAGWQEYQHAADPSAERAVLYSIARRRSLTRSDALYEKRIKEAEARASRIGRAHDQAVEELRQLRLQAYLEPRSRLGLPRHGEYDHDGGEA
ncbi:hypothetical protein [Achromobacter insuavis]|uniref:hypothetical protein n=1 Tax=Achromobacter insuavis TaxID=1287735 RepID=UPI001F13C773|nr:hypothetical protein [Achromobacter insuavis]